MNIIPLIIIFNQTKTNKSSRNYVRSNPSKNSKPIYKQRRRHKNFEDRQIVTNSPNSDVLFAISYSLSINNTILVSQPPTPYTLNKSARNELNTHGSCSPSSYHRCTSPIFTTLYPFLSPNTTILCKSESTYMSQSFSRTRASHLRR